MSARIVVFGATGYTGELTARALVARGATPVLAARNRERLEKLAAELGGLEMAVADVERPGTVRALVQRGDVLVATVGPFARWGEAAVEAAIDAGAHYLDSTGEPSFIRAVFERYGPRAEQAGCGLLTAFGFDWVPGNLAGALALREAGPAAVRVAVGYYVTGSGVGGGALSGGTQASAAGAVLNPGFAWRGGQIVTERGAKRIASFEIEPGKRAPAISSAGSEHFALPRLAPGLREVDVYLGALGPMSRPMQGISLAISGVTAIPGVRGALQGAATKLIKGSTGGPDADARAKSGTLLIAHAYDASGARLSDVRLEGDNAYTVTGGMLAWGAETAGSGALRGTGALGPADGFGVDELQAGVAEAGIARVGEPVAA